MHFKYILFLSSFLFLSQELKAQNDLRIEIDKIIRFDTEIDLKKIPGFIITVLDEDSTYFFSYGYKDKKVKQKGKILPNDIFEIGSITKVFTSSLIEIFCQQKILGMHDKVNNFLPEEFRNPRLSELTIESLVNHQSGMPLRPDFFGLKETDSSNPYAFYTEKDLLTFYRDFIIQDSTFSYSHTNYALLELIIKNVTNLDYDEALKKYIFEPLSMSKSFVDFPEQRVDFIAPGYDKSQKKTTPWTFETFGASEGLKTTPQDMLNFIKYHFGKQNNLALSPSSIAFNNSINISNGWYQVNVKDFLIETHTGRTSGHNVFVAMVKQTNTAVIIMTNSWFGTGDLGFQILRMINNNWKKDSF